MSDDRWADKARKAAVCEEDCGRRLPLVGAERAIGMCLPCLIEWKERVSKMLADWEFDQRAKENY